MNRYYSAYLLLSAGFGAVILVFEGGWTNPLMLVSAFVTGMLFATLSGIALNVALRFRTGVREGRSE
ncbi:hypothetical protein ACFO0N_10915 [Halobium salinum]|uniref:Uncharacterized protein n=1 Tax=Halobium salinum TaxID=1364940 RepID=A0ABD5PCS3_9EURY|nr:hypothetical protein [Halobium salinum]